MNKSSFLPLISNCFYLSFYLFLSFCLRFFFILVFSFFRRKNFGCHFLFRLKNLWYVWEICDKPDANETATYLRPNLAVQPQGVARRITQRPRVKSEERPARGDRSVISLVRCRPWAWRYCTLRCFDRRPAWPTCRTCQQVLILWKPKSSATWPHWCPDLHHNTGVWADGRTDEECDIIETNRSFWLFKIKGVGSLRVVG